MRRSLLGSSGKLESTSRARSYTIGQWTALWGVVMAVRYCCGAARMLALAVLGLLVGGNQRVLAGSRGFDIPAQSLADSLQAVADQADINMVFDPPVVAGRNAPEVKGASSAADALSRLLMGTGLKYEFLNEK